MFYLLREMQNSSLPIQLLRLLWNIAKPKISVFSVLFFKCFYLVVLILERCGCRKQYFSDVEIRARDGSEGQYYRGTNNNGWKYAINSSKQYKYRHKCILQKSNIVMLSFIRLNIQNKIQSISKQGSSYLLIAKNTILEGMIVLMDSVRREAAESVQLLNKV